MIATTFDIAMFLSRVGDCVLRADPPEKTNLLIDSLEIVLQAQQAIRHYLEMFSLNVFSSSRRNLTALL